MPVGKLARIVDKKRAAFEALMTCTGSFEPREVTVKDIFPSMEGVCKIKRWTVANVQPMVDALAGVYSTRPAGATDAEMAMLVQFQDRWLLFVDCHPVLAGQLDPS